MLCLHGGSRPARPAPVQARPALRRFEAIPVLINRGEPPAMFAGKLQLLPQAADVRVHRSRADAGAEVPDVLQQRVAADDASLTADQVAGQLVFALGELDFL